MKKQEEIEKKILKKIIPDSAFRLKTQKTVENIKKEIQKEISKRKLPAKIELAGSTAKDTYLEGSMDIDFFILYPTTYSKEKIADSTLSLAKQILTNTEESYAEHPYLKGYFDGFLVEIVPCYQIENVSQKLSAVDRTPLHTKYIKDKLKENQKSQVRLLKQFLNGIGCYGAEAQVQGFSGYLCEILILKYENFEKLIREAQNWKTGTKISLEKDVYPDFDTPLVFIDPVDPERNVSSALSQEKFDLFIKACEEYSKKPLLTFFLPNRVKTWSIKKIKKTIEDKNYYFVGIIFNKPSIIDENLYPQIRKALRSIMDSCERNDFRIYNSFFHIDESKDKIYLILKTEDKELPETFIHQGPPTKLKENKDDFIEKWEKNEKAQSPPFEKKGRILVEVKREHTKIDDFLKDTLKDLSLGRHLDKNINETFKVIGLEDLLNRDLKEFWTIFLDGKSPWER